MSELNTSTTLLMQRRTSQSLPGITCHGLSVPYHVLEVQSFPVGFLTFLSHNTMIQILIIYL